MTRMIRMSRPLSCQCLQSCSTRCCARSLVLQSTMPSSGRGMLPRAGATASAAGTTTASSMAHARSIWRVGTKQVWSWSPLNPHNRRSRLHLLGPRRLQVMRQPRMSTWTPRRHLLPQRLVHPHQMQLQQQEKRHQSPRTWARQLMPHLRVLSSTRAPSRVKRRKRPRAVIAKQSVRITTQTRSSWQPSGTLIVVAAATSRRRTCAGWCTPWACTSLSVLHGTL
mmetsp:Transcript_19965/g.43461  ORF Transcript_19965/g.43461 Transcript_19965/m.43461 type:complete len:224 (-) Transcript_19965:575-1246(-)